MRVSVDNKTSMFISFGLTNRTSTRECKYQYDISGDWAIHNLTCPLMNDSDFIIFSTFINAFRYLNRCSINHNYRRFICEDNANIRCVVSKHH